MRLPSASAPVDTLALEASPAPRALAADASPAHGASSVERQARLQGELLDLLDTQISRLGQQTLNSQATLRARVQAALSPPAAQPR